MPIQYATESMNYGQAKEILEEWIVGGKQLPMTEEQVLAQSMMAQTPVDSDLPLIFTLGDGPVSTEGEL